MLDGIFLARPEEPGPGIRLAVKDLFDTEGLTTTYGSILFAEHVPARTAVAVRRLEAAGAELGVYTDAPVELARIALSHLGAARRVSRLEAGSGALERLVAELGADTVVVATRDDLVASTI